MIKRIWRGRTTPANADRYEHLLRGEIFEGIASKEIPGYRGIELLRHEGDDEVEFVTMMTFDSLDAVRAFAGDDFEMAYVPAAARAVRRAFTALRVPSARRVWRPPGVRPGRPSDGVRRRHSRRRVASSLPRYPQRP